MMRERALKIVLALLGLVFAAAIYPLVTSLREGWQANKGRRFADDAPPVCHRRHFFVGGSREPIGESERDRFRRTVEFRSPRAVMTVMSAHLPNERRDLLVASVVFAAIGAILIVLGPAKQSGQRASAGGT